MADNTDETTLRTQLVEQYKHVEKIGLNVLIKNKKNNSGSILFEYKDIDQLNKIIEIIKSHY